MRDVLPFVNTGALVLVAAGLVYVGAQVSATSSRLQQLVEIEAAAPTVAVATARDRDHAAPHRPRRTAAQMPPPSAAPPVEAAIDDHLWSEEGRAVIEDVVETRRQEERERHGERWRQMAEFRTSRAADQVAEELDLSEGDTEALQQILTLYMEQRSTRWRAMHDGDSDPEKIHKEAEEARAAFEEDVIALVGEAALPTVTSAIERRHF